MAKYGAVWDGWRSSEPSGSHGVGLWKYICKGWRLFQCHIRFDFGLGSNIRFWEDIWCGDTSLKNAFPELFNIATNKDVSIADNRDCLNGSVQWNVTFIRRVHDWEVEVLASFYTLLYSHTMRGEGEDRMWWIPSRRENSR